MNRHTLQICLKTLVMLLLPIFVALLLMLPGLPASGASPTPTKGPTVLPTPTPTPKGAAIPAVVPISIERVSVASDGAQGNSLSEYPAISGDGRYVAFHSYASNLVPSDTNGTFDVFVVGLGTPSGSVQGRVNLQGRANEGGALVSLGGALTTTTASDGIYTFASVPEGTYTATITMDGYLPAQRPLSVTVGVTTTLPLVTLLGGDTDNDGDVDTIDLSRVGSSFGLSVPPGNPAADINGDGVVNILDLVMVGANFSKSAPSPWPGAITSASLPRPSAP